MWWREIRVGSNFFARMRNTSLVSWNLVVHRLLLLREWGRFLSLYLAFRRRRLWLFSLLWGRRLTNFYWYRKFTPPPLFPLFSFFCLSSSNNLKTDSHFQAGEKAVSCGVTNVSTIDELNFIKESHLRKGHRFFLIFIAQSLIFKFGLNKDCCVS